MSTIGESHLMTTVLFQSSIDAKKLSCPDNVKKSLSRSTWDHFCCQASPWRNHP